MELQQAQYQKVAAFLYAQAGINLGKNRQSLVESRLHKRVKQLGLASWGDYTEYLFANPQLEKNVIIEALTTHKTDWFRDSEHYDVLLQQAAKSKIPFMIWSAASSTGEEAYSSALALLSSGYTTKDFRILGTDISQDVVKKAEAGKYSNHECNSVLNEYPDFARRSLDGSFQIGSELRESTKFRSLNLVDFRLPADLQFDFIFLRNVLIYFDPQSTEIAIRNVLRHLRPGGLLVLGLSETLRLQISELKGLGRAVYQHQPKSTSRS